MRFFFNPILLYRKYSLCSGGIVHSRNILEYSLKGCSREKKCHTRHYKHVRPYTVQWNLVYLFTYNNKITYRFLHVRPKLWRRITSRQISEERFIRSAARRLYNMYINLRGSMCVRMVCPESIPIIIIKNDRGRQPVRINLNTKTTLTSHSSPQCRHSALCVTHTYYNNII